MPPASSAQGPRRHSTRSLSRCSRVSPTTLPATRSPTVSTDPGCQVSSSGVDAAQSCRSPASSDESSERGLHALKIRVELRLLGRCQLGSNLQERLTRDARDGEPTAAERDASLSRGGRVVLLASDAELLRPRLHRVAHHDQSRTLLRDDRLDLGLLLDRGLHMKQRSTNGHRDDGRTLGRSSRSLRLHRRERNRRHHHEEQSVRRTHVHLRFCGVE